ncbi:Amidohydrolase [Shimia sp. SK013]|uniref:amidohydrolase family protein n=1 Tax=Shimia sp. SK013 TaxID=1389006 RepID=UPI0006B4C922|nr:amidohydrolase family protein [Shimia sp. SK013]KPA20287.1 Amidohydrolase [Shimia sp. SK013]
MIIDAHQHFWKLARGDYPWPNETVADIFYDFEPADLAPLLCAAGVDHTVLVQATDTVAETEFLLQIANNVEWVAGVVGWTDLEAIDAIDVIDRLHQHPALKGLRPMLQNIADTDWILQDTVAPALSHMADLGLCFDALIQPRHLEAIEQIAKRHPTLAIVIDHIAKPKMGGAQAPDNVWVDGMARLADLPNVHCKLSGLVTEIGPTWKMADLAPFAGYVLQTFGPDRVLFGSDWPVVNLASSYTGWRESVDTILADFSPEDRTKIMGRNAAAFYGLCGHDKKASQW